ncbi:MAG: CvpA family protein [Betaproteobacteria bacterium]|nr:CvpA family protein [Betaproteobacteria bacterium]
MTWFDYAVLTIIGISVLLSIIHGFVRELLALASWFVAFIAAQMYAADIAPLLPAAIPGPSLRLLAAFLAMFLMVLLVMTLAAIAASSLIRSAGLGVADRALGAVFGLVRGLAMVMVVVVLAGLTTLPRQPVWRNAMFSAPLEALANVIKVWLPYDLSKHINYE